MFKQAALASRWFFRGLKRGDWLWLLVAVFIASMTVTLIKHIGDSIEYSMERKAAASLQADLILQSTRPIDPNLVTKAQTLGLQTRLNTQLVTMVLANDQFQLVKLSAISSPEPLIGSNQFLQRDTFPVKDLDSSHAWIDPKLVELLNLNAYDRLTLGEIDFSIGGVVEPKIVVNPMAQFAPSITIDAAILEQTALLGAGSRATYQLEMTGSRAGLLAFEKKLKAENNPAWQILSAQQSENDLGEAINNAKLFIDLSAFATVLIAGMSILIAGRFYLERWRHSLVTLRSIGASNRQLSQLFIWQFIWLALLSSSIGVLLGLTISYALTPLLTNFFAPWHWVSPLKSIAIGLLSGTLVLFAFSWQVLQSVLQFSPMQFQRSRQQRNDNFKHWLVSLSMLGVLTALIIDLEFLPWVISGVALLILGLYGSAWLLLKLLHFSNRNSSGWLRIALSNVTREPQLFKVQIISLGVVLFALILMTFLRQDLLNEWQESLPSDAPNHFVMNIQPDQRETVQTIFSQNLTQSPELVAMARGRITHKNAVAYQIELQNSARAKRMLNREANIAFLPEIPTHNIVTAQLPAEKFNGIGVSVEQDIAKLLGIALGDTLTFNFAGQEFEAQVRSLRQVKWQSFELNFFFIIEQENPASAIPISYITNFHLPRATSNTQMTQELAVNASGVLMIDVRKILQDIQEIMAQASLAVSWLYSFTLLASIAVLFSATLASQQARIQNWMLLRTLGATSAQILKIGISEFAIIGAAAGVIAASFSQLASILIGGKLLNQAPSLDISIWAQGIFIGACIVILIGFVTQRHYLKMSAHHLKRHLSAH